MKNRNMNNSKAKDFKGTLNELLKYLSKYKIQIILVILFAILSATFSIIGPKILGKATTEIFNGLISKVTKVGNGINFSKIGKILLFLLGLYAISSICSFLQNFIMSKVSQNISYNLRKQISKKINLLPIKYFDNKSNGEVLSKITNDVDLLSQNLNQVLTQVITSITTVIGVLIMMISISPLMTICSLIIIPFSLIIISFVLKRSQKYFRMQQEYLGYINAQVEEVYAGHTIVKTYSHEEKCLDTFKDTNETLYESAWKSQFLSGLMMPVMQFIGNLGYVIVSILGGYLVILEKIQVGDVLSFTQYVRSFVQPITQVAQVANLIQSLVAASERVFEFLNEDEEVKDVENPKSTANIKGNVEFCNVSFGYDPSRIIIRNFNAKIKNGMKVAIVGPTGAGKTTIVKLLMRFYDINSGSIKIDGVDIRDFRRNDLRQLFGMVLQDSWLFNGTIKENISYGKLDATLEEVVLAAKASKVDHFIKTLPDTYNMMINEESSNISQGQKQLLTIARVILADPKILILDEATSNVDTKTEIEIQLAMDNLMKNRTSFIIAHRLSTIKNADLILVMNDGDIVEQGKHEELLKKDGFYKSLYYSQFDKSEE